MLGVTESRIVRQLILQSETFPDVCPVLEQGNDAAVIRLEERLEDKNGEKLGLSEIMASFHARILGQSTSSRV